MSNFLAESRMKLLARTEDLADAGRRAAKKASTKATETGHRLAEEHGDEARDLARQSGKTLIAVAENEDVQEVAFSVIEQYAGPRAAAVAETVTKQAMQAKNASGTSSKAKRAAKKSTRGSTRAKAKDAKAKKPSKRVARG
jgi:hypothetical protein